MSQKGLNINLSIREIYDKVCPACKEKIRVLIREKVTDAMLDQVIGPTENPKCRQCKP